MLNVSSGIESYGAYLTLHVFVSVCHCINAYSFSTRSYVSGVLIHSIKHQQ